MPQRFPPLATPECAPVRAKPYFPGGEFLMMAMLFALLIA